MIAPAILDACVLNPPSLHDLLGWVAIAGNYAPKLSAGKGNSSVEQKSILSRL
jgi:hypothetical protein